MLNKLRMWRNKRKLKKLYNRLEQIKLYLAYDRENKDKLVLRGKLIEEIRRLERMNYK